jgi:Tol biopolymer transport system component
MLRKSVAINILGLFGGIIILLGGGLVIGQRLPDHRQILYMANFNAQYDLFLSDLRTLHTLQMTRGQSQNSRYPEWSPDGRYIAYHGQIEQRHGIFIMDTQTWDVDWVDFGLDDLGEVYDEAMVSWSPDGSKIAFHRGSDRAGYAIYIADVTGANPIRLTTGEGHHIHAYWSPDGSKIAYTRYEIEDGRLSNIGVIYVLDVEDAIKGVDGVGERITRGIFPAWSPDGGRLVYADDSTGDDQIYVYDFEYGTSRQLTTGSLYQQNTMPDWSPDGEWIVFTSNRSVNYGIYRIRHDGTDLARLSVPITQFNLQAPAWRP